MPSQPAPQTRRAEAGELHVVAVLRLPRPAPLPAVFWVGFSLPPGATVAPKAIIETTGVEVAP